LSWWHFHPKNNFAEDDIHNFCACGGYRPSRPHYVWCCSNTAGYRSNLGVPTNRAEERLFARILPEYPAPPRVECLDTSINAMLPGLSAVFDTPGDFVYIATDGAAKNGVAAWAVYLPQVGATSVSGVAGEDQSAFKAEVAAIDIVIAACTRLPRICAARKTIVIVTDCLSAIQVISSERDDSCQLPLLVGRIRDHLQTLRSRGHTVEFAWVPSHGKIKVGWLPHPAISEKEMRDWNAVADSAASVCLQNAYDGSDRKLWWELAQQAAAWEVSTIKAAAAISKFVQTHLSN